MRLHKIKLAGFKSFVDPTTITLPSNLIGIVGPNGCGKSNTIDAVRWVMGESSAKHLRGESMDDVIFTGSNSRKPVGKASIELVFDNTSGKVGGEYAKYAEIAIRREVTRDGQSQYFLNGARCRRRDITDLFLGTGLGPRSYSIIEQGMISRLIEAKPQDLRMFFEEAAGISKYKERRRETENRIRHTRENLERLNDLRDEIAKQLRHLERQSKSAEKYKEYKILERKLKAELVELRLQKLDAELAEKQVTINERETAMEALTADLRRGESQLETARAQRITSNDEFQTVQAAFYQLGGEINSVEQGINFQRENITRRQREREEAEDRTAKTNEELERDQTELLELESMLEELEPELELSREQMADGRERLDESENAMSAWRESWEDFNRKAAEPAQKAQVERARMEQLERSLQRLEERRNKLVHEQGNLNPGPVEDLITRFSEELLEQQQVQEEAQQTLEEAQSKIESLRSDQQTVGDQLSENQQQEQQARGRLASLEALQQAALGKDKKRTRQWLQQRGLEDASRLAEKISAQAPWGRAVETVLGDYLEAVEVADLTQFPSVLNELDKGSVILFEQHGDSAAASADTLWSKVDAPASIQGLLSSIRIAESIDQAMAMRSSLAVHESVMTADGLWLGKSWMRFSTAEDDRAGVLERKQEIIRLTAVVEESAETIEKLKSQHETGRAQLQALEQQRQEHQSQVNQAHRGFSETNSRLGQQKARLEQFGQRLNGLAIESEDLLMQIESEQEALQVATEARNAAVGETENYARERERYEAERNEIQQRLTMTRQQLEEQRSSLHEKQLKTESFKSKRQSTASNLERMRRQSAELSERLNHIASDLAEADEPLEEMRMNLETLLEQRLVREQSLNLVRGQLQAVENELRELEKQRHGTDEKINASRQGLEDVRLNARELTVRVQTQIEQLREMQVSREEARADLAEDATPELWNAEVERIASRISRLGPINLAAIDEYKDQSERQVHLDSQYEDLTDALTTLENAIHKIDKETRSRFKDTFDHVNASLQVMFPKLFGGGQAHLELTDDDLLTTGVLIMARPPGKRITNIHLMSGGEKALTAVAMIFAIFELNPAPFCMLDEVDAPLDDANVGRFCDLVREMSEHVQFIFITHNKVTMELAEQLIGVTMRESGVSRLVDVDVDEAALMAIG